MSAPTRLSEATTCSQGRGSRGRTLSTWMKVGEIGSGTSVECRFGCGDWRGSGSGTREWGGCLVRRLVPVHTSVVVWSSLVWYGTRAGTRSRPTQCYHQVKHVFAATQVAPPPVVLGAAPHQHLSQHTCTDCFFLLYTTPVVARSLHSNSLCLFTSPSMSRLGLCHTGIA